MDLFIGLDVGTSVVKGILVSADGRKLALGKRLTRFLHPQPGWVELDPEEHYRSVCDLIRELASHAPKGAKIRALSMAFASGNTLFLDGGGNPLTNIYSWLDTRGLKRMGELLPGLDPKEVHGTVGWFLNEFFPLVHISWFRRHEPDKYRRLGRVCMNNDYLFQRLTGRWGMDVSTATTFYLQNQVQGRWHRPYLEFLGLTEAMLPEIYPSGTVLGPLTQQAAEDTGLAHETLAVLGGFDHPCAARGTGILNIGDLLLSCGTSWVAFFPIADRQLGVAQNLLVDPFLTPRGPWGSMMALSAIAVPIDKYIEVYVLQPGEDPARKYAIFNEAAVATPAGAEGLYINLYDDYHSSFQGIHKPLGSHSRGEVSRALMEATAFEMRLKLEELAAAGIRADRQIMVGGPSESPIWPKIVAEVLGLPLTLLNGQTAGALGAAILAAIGAGIFRDEAEAFAAMGGRGTVLEPEESRIREYERLYEGFLEFKRRSAG